MTATVVVIGILLLGVVLTTAFLLRGSSGRRRALPDVPPAMRPAYSDDELERTVQYRYRAWGMVLFIFFALFLPVYWYFESQRLNAATEGFFVQSVVRGEALYTENCATCHGADGGGGVATSPYGGDTWPAPNLLNIAARYEENNNVSDVHDLIVTTLERGRPGTPMPAWGAAYGGPLTDAQIEEITDWILSQQTGEVEEVASVDVSGELLYVENCARCHGEEGNGLFVPEEPGEDPVLRPGPSLIGVFARHERETILGILRNGIYLGSSIPSMPPWQAGYMYPPQELEGAGLTPARYDDDALNAIVDHLETLQPAELPESADQYQTPGTGLPGNQPPGGASGEGDETTTALRDAARG